MKRFPSVFEITEAIKKKEVWDSKKKDNLTNSSQMTPISMEITIQDWEANITARPRSSQQYLNNHEQVEDEIYPEDNNISDNKDNEIQFAINKQANVQSLSDILLAEAAKQSLIK